MAKINISKSGIGVRGLRVMVGIPGHAASAHARCVGNTLRGQDHPAAPLGSGGMRNDGWQQRFIATSRSCGTSVPKVPRTRKTPIA